MGFLGSKKHTMQAYKNYTNKYMKLKLLLITLFSSLLNWGQVTEGFEGTPPPAGWTYTSVTHETVNFRSGAQCAGFNANNDAIVSPLVSTPQTLSFWWKRSGTSPTSPQFTVQYGSTPTGPWTNITTGSTNPITSFTTTYQQFTADLSALSNVYIRVLHTRTAGANIVYIDDFSISSITSTPTVSVSSTTLTGFSYVVGSGPSTTQSFVVSGSNLTSDLVLTAPLNYEISNLAGGPFLATMNYTPASGTVSPSTIFVRLKGGLSVGTYNTENIVVSSTGATTQNVNCNGVVTGSSLSDIVAVIGSESTSISSVVNDAAPLSSSTGIQVWQFKVRDGGSTLSDPDNLPTILNAFNLAQSAGNAIGTWTDAINTVALFDGTTFIASGIVTANQIQFSGLNVIVGDNTEKTLSIRVSLKCPLGVDAFDNEDFGFSLSNANTTFAPSGSGKTTFTAQTSANGRNIIAVIASNLNFTIHPVTTGINNTMANVIVAATDSCGNIDLDFLGNISLTSTGTMTVSPLTITASGGVSNFATIIHTVLGTGLTLNATSTGLISATSGLFDITAVTAFSPGDFAVIALNSNITCYPAGPNGAYTAGDDEISFITFKDIQNGDTFSITDNGFERLASGLWGDQEGVYTITRTGGVIPAGTVITIRLRNVAPLAEFISPDSSWTVARAAGFPTGSLVMNSGGDQIFFMQGGSWSNPVGTADAVYTPGVYLYAFNTNSAWNSLMNSTQHSGLPIDLRCFSLMPGSATDFLEYTGPISAASKLDWIARLNNPSNWTNRINCAGYLSVHVGQTYSIISGGTYIDGVWTGAKSTDWFDCSNWQTLKVPDQTVDVDINATYAQRNAVIDIVTNASNASIYGNIAKSNNISISDKVLQIEANSGNRLDVHGNLLIEIAGSIDMDDSNASTSDGVINLYGNWTNDVGNMAFSEGNSTVNFTGNSPQIINNITPEGTEIFYNVILNNDFSTSISNDLIATGNLIINTGKNITIAPNDYIQVNENLTNNGVLNVQNSGSLIQVNDSGVNIGNISVERIATIRQLDYVLWSSPVLNFLSSSISPLTPSSFVIKWDPIIPNPNGGFGNWVNGNEIMTLGKGYAVRGPNGFNNSTPSFHNANFNGLPNNGIINVAIARGGNVGGDYLGVNGVTITRFDDNWNLVGNPYPSAINALDFLNANTNIEGSVSLWTHNTLPSSTIGDPFYQDFQINYTASDYIVHNGTATTSGPFAFNGLIASGQSFFVLMNDGPATNSNVVFNNSMRNKSYNNSQFFKSGKISNAERENNNEKHRIWLDLISNSSNSALRTVVGYVEGATNQKDRMFDAYADIKQAFSFYSIIDQEAVSIQGKSLPFNENDVVKMGVKIPNQGFYKIAIFTVDGLFLDNNQNIYLEDKLLNIVYDLRNAPYEFYSQAGRFDDRFILKFKEQTLNVEDFNNGGVNVFSQNENLIITSKNNEINSVKIYSVLGQLIYQNSDVNNNELNVYLQKNNSPFIIEIKLENGKIINIKSLH